MKEDEEESLHKKKLNNKSCLKTSFKLIMVFHYHIFKAMFVLIIHKHRKSPILIYQFFLLFKMDLGVDFNFYLL